MMMPPSGASGGPGKCDSLRETGTSISRPRPRLTTRPHDTATPHDPSRTRVTEPESLNPSHGTQVTRPTAPAQIVYLARSQTELCSKEVEAPGVEPGSRNASRRTSTGLVRHLLPRERLRRTGSEPRAPVQSRLEDHRQGLLRPVRKFGPPVTITDRPWWKGRLVKLGSHCEVVVHN